MTTRPLTLVLTALALLVVAGPAAASGASERREATRLLRGTAWTTYQSGTVTGASQDRTIHLCRNGTFVVVSSFVAPYIEDSSSYDHPYGESRVTGRWRVAKVRGSGVLVRYATEDGQRGSVAISVGRGGPRIGGLPAQVDRSDVC